MSEFDRARSNLREEDQKLSEMREAIMALFNSMPGVNAEAMMRRFDSYGQQMYNFGFANGRYIAEGQIEMDLKC
ncbi:hypothetical protein D3C76_222050 [compost metagenome]